MGEIEEGVGVRNDHPLSPGKRVQGKGAARSFPWPRGGGSGGGVGTVAHHPMTWIWGSKGTGGATEPLGEHKRDGAAGVVTLVVSSSLTKRGANIRTGHDLLFNRNGGTHVRLY